MLWESKSETLTYCFARCIFNGVFAAAELNNSYTAEGNQKTSEGGRKEIAHSYVHY